MQAGASDCSVRDSLDNTSLQAIAILGLPANNVKDQVEGVGLDAVYGAGIQIHEHFSGHLKTCLDWSLNISLRRGTPGALQGESVLKIGLLISHSLLM